jgi:septal ring factor EnvC (AmiA/AmiB activator)
VTDTSTNGIIPWLLAAMASLAATLSSALAYVYRKREAENAERITDLKAEAAAFRTELDVVKEESDECKKQRAELATSVAVNTYKIQVLEEKLKQS